MKDFIAPGLALVGPHEVQKTVFLQELLGDVGAEVGACSSKGIGDASLSGLGVAPKDVEYLGNICIQK